MKKACFGCKKATGLTKHFKKEAINQVGDGETENVVNQAEETWVFSLRRCCSVGGETVKDFDACISPREFEKRV
jgi:hypothetical protein